ncbi:hypothetical protein BDQ17DRAFT_1076003 [Cyathus striatus]|nr:hypothetical protein BDQ17DRAFT_1076003 [Cyathus striatus]
MLDIYYSSSDFLVFEVRGVSLNNIYFHQSHTEFLCEFLMLQAGHRAHGRRQAEIKAFTFTLPNALFRCYFRTGPLSKSKILMVLVILIHLHDATVHPKFSYPCAQDWALMLTTTILNAAFVRAILSLALHASPGSHTYAPIFTKLPSAPYGTISQNQLEI